MVFDFTVMYKDETVTDVHIDTRTNKNTVKRHIYGPRQPFNCGRSDMDFIYDFLRWRGFENRRFDLHRILHTAEVFSEDESYDWTSTTHHGANPMDCWWVRFPGEYIRWDDVNPRRNDKYDVN